MPYQKKVVSYLYELQRQYFCSPQPTQQFPPLHLYKECVDSREGKLADKWLVYSSLDGCGWCAYRERAARTPAAVMMVEYSNSYKNAL
jgi:hypothetical protein